REGRRHCEEPPGLAFGEPDDRLRDEAIHSSFRGDNGLLSRSLSSGAHSRDLVARNDGAAYNGAAVSRCAPDSLVARDATTTTIEISAITNVQIALISGFTPSRTSE